MLTPYDLEILGTMASQTGPSLRERLQTVKDAELANQRFTQTDVDNFDRYEALQDIRAAVRKDLVPLKIEGLLNRDYDKYFESGAADVNWIRSY